MAFLNTIEQITTTEASDQKQQQLIGTADTCCEMHTSLYKVNDEVSDLLDEVALEIKDRELDTLMREHYDDEDAAPAQPTRSSSAPPLLSFSRFPSLVSNLGLAQSQYHMETGCYYVWRHDPFDCVLDIMR